MAKNVERDVLNLIMDRAPNWVRDTIVVARLNKYDAGDVSDALMKLGKENTLDELVLGGSSHAYRWPEAKTVYVRETITIGNTEVPRILESSEIAMSLEDINEQVERLAEHSDTLEERFSGIVKDERRKYWGNTITLFGLFVAVFSFIMVSLPRIQVGRGLTFSQIFAVNLAQILPLAIVLLLFILVLKLLFR